MTSPTINRVVAHADALRTVIQSGRKPDGTPLEPGALERLDADLAIDLLEFAVFQDVKSRAQLHGLITTEEALTVYHALGGAPGSNGGWAPDTDLAMKVTVTGLIKQILEIERRHRS